MHLLVLLNKIFCLYVFRFPIGEAEGHQVKKIVADKRLEYGCTKVLVLQEGFAWAGSLEPAQPIPAQPFHYAEQPTLSYWRNDRIGYCASLED